MPGESGTRWHAFLPIARMRSEKDRDTIGTARVPARASRNTEAVKAGGAPNPVSPRLSSRQRLPTDAPEILHVGFARARRPIHP